MVGNYRQDLRGRAAEPANLFFLTPQEMRQIGRGFEVPAFAPLDQMHASLLVMIGDALQCVADIAYRSAAEEACKRFRSHRFLCCKQGSFYSAIQLLHQVETRRR